MDRPRARRRRGAGEGWRRVKDYLRQFVSFMFSNVGIVGLVVSYAIAGAFIFQAIEGGAAGATGTGAATVTTARGRVVRELWGATSRVLSEADWRDLAAAEVAKLQQAVVDAAHNNGLDASPPPRRLALDDEEDRADGGAGDEEEEVAASSQWSFSGSFLYSLTVITTIGYGNVAPQTKWGKLATILYAIAGMPLFLLYLSNIGDILAKSFKWTYAQCCLCRWCNSSTSSTPRVKKTRRRSHRRRRRHRSSRRRTSRASLRRRASVWSHEVAAARGGTAMAAGGGSGAVWPGADSWPPEEDMMDGDGGDTEDDDDDSEDDSEDDSSDDDDDSEEDEEDTDGLEVVDGAGPAAVFGGAAPGVGSAVGPGFGSRVGSGVGSGGVAGGGGGSSRSGGAAAAAESVTVPVTLCLAIMVGYVCGGAMLFAKWEDWDFLDGSYFCFISLSTIGFGDIVPGDRITSGNGVELSFIFCSAYLMLGMALIAMCFSLMQEEVVHKMRGLMRAVKAMGRCLCGRRRGGDDPGGGVGAGGGRGAAAGDIPLEQRMAMR